MAKSKVPKPASGAKLKTSVPEPPATNGEANAKSLKLAAERRKLADASMLQAQKAVIAAVQGIAEIVHGPA